MLTKKTPLGPNFVWTRDVLDVLRRSPGSEKWPTDEDMAGEIIARIKSRRNA